MFKPQALAGTGTAVVPAWLQALSGEQAQSHEFAPLVLPAGPEEAHAPAPPPPPDPAIAEREMLEAALAEAREEGRREGHAAGLAEAAAGNEERRRLGSAIRALDEDMTQQLADLLAQTVRALCEQTLQPLALDAALLQRRCQSAAALLEAERRDCAICLHPDDIARLEPQFRQEWTIRPDPALAPGDLHVEHRDAIVSDGPSEWSQRLAEALDAC